MSNFDVAVGITLKKLNTTLKDYYTAKRKSFPFTGQETKDITIVTTPVPVTVNWTVDEAPCLQLGPPTESVWEQALTLDAQGKNTGKTNKESNTPLPKGLMASVNVPSLTVEADYELNKQQQKKGGTAKDTIIYGTLDRHDTSIMVNPVAVTIDESKFGAIDAKVFNRGILKQIYEIAKPMLSVITVPTLSFEGISLEPLSVTFSNQILIASSVMKGNGKPIDVSGVTWPTDQMFVLISQPLINAALALVPPQLQGKIAGGANVSFPGTGLTLAHFNFSGSVDSASLTVASVSPLTINAALTVSASLSAGLTPAGKGIAAAGCPLGGALALA